MGFHDVSCRLSDSARAQTHTHTLWATGQPEDKILQISRKFTVESVAKRPLCSVPRRYKFCTDETDEQLSQTGVYPARTYSQLKSKNNSAFPPRHSISYSSVKASFKFSFQILPAHFTCCKELRNPQNKSVQSYDLAGRTVGKIDLFPVHVQKYTSFLAKLRQNKMYFMTRNNN